MISADKTPTPSMEAKNSSLERGSAPPTEEESEVKAAPVPRKPMGVGLPGMGGGLGGQNLLAEMKAKRTSMQVGDNSHTDHSFPHV